jgi:hypothetical protein
MFESLESMGSEAYSARSVTITVPANNTARRLCFDNDLTGSPEPRNHVIFSASPVSQLTKSKRGRGKKIPTPYVETDLRRSKRTCVRKQGYKHGSSVKIMEISEEADNSSDSAPKMPQEEVIPETPIRIMQRVGEDLGIAPEKITEEKLKVVPKSKKSKKGANDK